MKIKNGSKYTLNGWNYISISGKPYERGVAHGILLSNEIIQAIKTLEFNLYETHGINFAFFINIGKFFFRKPTEENYPELFDEMRGITDGVNKSNKTDKLTIDEIILWNNSASIDYVLSKITDYIDDLPFISQEHKNLISNLHPVKEGGGAKDRCSAFMAIGSYTHDGKICCAHNSFDDYISGQFFNCIIDINPTNGNRILYQGAPGYISSQTDFFITNNGFIGTETTIGGFNSYKYGDPITCRIRKCMQYAKSLNDYVKFLTNNNAGDYANSWLIGDTKNNEIMRIELGLNYVNIEKKKKWLFYRF
jgi:hypothetical protein